MLLSGGIDSSLYGSYLNLERSSPPLGFYCSFGQDDPEYPYARAIAERLGVDLRVAIMEKTTPRRRSTTSAASRIIRSRIFPACRSPSCCSSSAITTTPAV